MFDLKTIHQMNDRAVADSMLTARAGGQYVVATYRDQNLLGFETFESSMDAIRHLNRPSTRGEYRTLYSPLPPALPANRATDGYDVVVGVCCAVCAAALVALIAAGAM